MSVQRLLYSALYALFPLAPVALAQVTELINISGDGLGNGMSAPSALAIDRQGNVYVCGEGSDNVMRIPLGGGPTQILSPTGSGSGHFLCAPRGLAVDADNNVFVSGSVSDNVFKITPAGVVTQIIDYAGDGMGNVLDGPDSLTVDPEGNVYVSGALSSNVFQITPSGVVTEVIDIFGDNSGHFLNEARGLAFDDFGNLFVAGEFSRNVFKVSPGGAITQVLDFTGDGSGNLLERPKGIAVDRQGNLYAAGYISNNLFKVTPEGVVTQLLEEAGLNNEEYERPMGVAVTGAGNVYSMGFFDSNVFLITPQGLVSVVAGFQGSPTAGNGFSRPIAIAVDLLGNVYVANRDSQNVLKFDRPREFPNHCNGDGGNQAGCTDCPCANNAPIGTVGGCVNSAGLSAQLIPSGDTSVSLPPSSTTDLRFEMRGGSPNAFGVLTSGDAVAPTNPMNLCTGFGSGIQSVSLDGLRCAVASTVRHGSRSIDGLGNVGVTNLPWGGEGAPLVGIAQSGVSFVAGQTRYFQVIYREDVMASCMRGLNSSQAVEVLFTP